MNQHGRRRAGQRSALADPNWQYLEKTSLDDITAGEWALLDRQRGPYLAEQIATQALAMLRALEHAPSFGYQLNPYEHCLQAATLALRDARDEETVVCALFHDLGFVVCNETHGEFAARLLQPYVSARNVWMLERHMYFLTPHCASHPRADQSVLERWRGHPDFAYTADWVARYDVVSNDADCENAPLEEFEPLVRRVFARPPRAVPFPA